MTKPSPIPLEGPELGKRVDEKTSDEIVRLARSTTDEDTDYLIKLGTRRGLRHPRFAVQAIEAQQARLYAKEANALASEMQKQSKWMMRLTIVVALSAIAQVVATIVGA